MKKHFYIFEIHSHTNKWEKSVIFNLCEKFTKPGSTYFEIGAHLGATSLTMAIAAKDKDAKVYCVDTWDNRTMPGPQVDTFEEWQKNTDRMRDIIIPIRKESVQAAASIENRTIDLIFFDGDHSHEGITSDINAWLPKCKDFAWLVFHDYGGQYGRPAIQQAIRELVWPVQHEAGFVMESLYWTKIRRIGL